MCRISRAIRSCVCARARSGTYKSRPATPTSRPRFFGVDRLRSVSCADAKLALLACSGRELRAALVTNAGLAPRADDSIIGPGPNACMHACRAYRSVHHLCVGHAVACTRANVVHARALHSCTRKLAAIEIPEEHSNAQVVGQRPNQREGRVSTTPPDTPGRSAPRQAPPAPQRTRTTSTLPRPPLSCCDTLYEQAGELREAQSEGRARRARWGRLETREAAERRGQRKRGQSDRRPCQRGARW